MTTDDSVSHVLLFCDKEFANKMNTWVVVLTGIVPPIDLVKIVSEIELGAA